MMHINSPGGICIKYRLKNKIKQLMKAKLFEIERLFYGPKILLLYLKLTQPNQTAINANIFIFDSIFYSVI